jgi:hypothetical protein
VTVKLRSSAGAIALSEEERALPIENDWTNEHQPAEARSLTETVADNLVDSVGSGSSPVAELFTDAQRQLVEMQVPGVAWNDLKRYGPIETRVWKKEVLKGFKEPVTIELWQLQQNGRTKELLEVSTKAKTATNDRAQELASQFFAEAKAVGLGQPDNQTKTQQVLDFFHPDTQSN